MSHSIDDIVIGSQLPVVEVLDELCLQLAQRHEAVLQAPPGAGKTTLVPLALLHQPWLNGRKILLLEPRRLAAKAAAERMANMLGETCGETVGYRMRLDTKIGARTRIEVITEGILTRLLQSDPALADVGLLIFDEFHERNLDADLGLTLALQGRELYRDTDPLKLLVMSATLDGDAIAALLGDAPLVQSAGKMYPVAVHYVDPPFAGRAQARSFLPSNTPAKATSIVPSVVATLWTLLEQPGDASILVFLPGQGEISAVEKALAQRLATLLAAAQLIDIAPLYGGLTLQQQRLAIEPAAAGRRKVVLATNIAETSLTIEGISIVVDSGLAREPRFDPRTGMTRLQTQPISRASSVQRMGRAGRLRPGDCYRLWSEQQQQQLLAHSRPEIQQADLAHLALQLLAWGVDDPHDLRWLDPPPTGPFQQALQLLREFGASIPTSAGGWQLTPHGEAMAAMPVHPRLAHMLLVGADLGLQVQACQLAALLSERDPLGDSSADLWQRLAMIAGEAHCPPARRGWRQRTLQQSKQFARLVHAPANTIALDLHLGLGLLVASAYPDRIARRRGSGSVEYVLGNGRGAQLDPADSLVNCEWLAVAQLGGRVGATQDRIDLAAALDPGLFDTSLAAQVRREQRVYWDDKLERLVAEDRRLLGELLLDTQPIANLDPQLRQQALLDMLQRQGLELLPWNHSLRQWQARIMLLRNNLPQAEAVLWPDVSDESLLASLDQWLLPYLDKADTLARLQKIDLASLLHNLLPWPLPRQLDALAPLRLTVPSGSSIEIDYSRQPPVLAVKLQEMFGCDATPGVANGRVPLVLHLLSPARRPLQITQDLAGFWRGSYQDVKKDMKGRYPKHPWPDDPLQALPTRHVKQRKPL
jgi:ATP-dependent helicase HrpB